MTFSPKSAARRWVQTGLVTLCFAVVTLLCFGVYLQRTLKGNIDNHILAGEMFGVPAAIAAHGVEPLYHGKGMTGWDGQFYYYISNDLLGRLDTPRHIDMPSYRYQRIGLPLYVAAAAALTGQSWVSPTTFFVSYFCLLLLAVWVGCGLFVRRGLPGALILVWAFGVGTQITLFNALPDAAADAFLIFGLALCQAAPGRRLWAALPFSLAALSREIYVIFPAAILLTEFLVLVSASRAARLPWRSTVAQVLGTPSLYAWSVPLVALLGWQAYLKLHFGASAGSGATGILGAPLAAWWDYLRSGYSGNHKLLGTDQWARWEAASLVTFALVLATAILVPAARLMRRELSLPALDLAVLSATCFLGGFYCFFGPVVMMHYTGYVKAIGVFSVLLPLCATAAGVGRPMVARLVALVLLLNLVTTGYYNWKSRIVLPDINFDRLTAMSSVDRNDEQACLSEHRARFALIEQRPLQQDKGALQSFFGKGELVRVKVRVTNAGSVPLVSSRAKGGVFVSYQWFKQGGKLVGDGIRSALRQPLSPGESADVEVVAYLPRRPGPYTMRVSAVQEGCAWFFQKDKASGLDVGFEIH